MRISEEMACRHVLTTPPPLSPQGEMRISLSFTVVVRDKGG